MLFMAIVSKKIHYFEPSQYHHQLHLNPLEQPNSEYMLHNTSSNFSPKISELAWSLSETSFIMSSLLLELSTIMADNFESMFKSEKHSKKTLEREYLSCGDGKWINLKKKNINLVNYIKHKVNKLPWESKN